VGSNTAQINSSRNGSSFLFLFQQAWGTERVDFERNGEWVLKKCVIENVFSVAMIAVAEFFLLTSA